MTERLTKVAWPVSRLGEAMLALAEKSGIRGNESEPVNPQRTSTNDGVGEWMEWHAGVLGCEAEAIETTLADLERDLAFAYPALLRISDGLYLAVIDAKRNMLRVLTADLQERRISLTEICDVICEPFERPKRAEIDQLFASRRMIPSRHSKAAGLLIREQLAETRFRDCWVLKITPGVRPSRWLHEPNAIRNTGRLLAAHIVQYLLWLTSWAVLGSLSFAGHMDRGWLLAWALLLITLVPFRLATTWLQGALAIGVGGILKRRLLAGALRLGPEEMRHCGLGSFLGQMFEAEALETLAVSGGIAGLLAIVELLISGFVLGRFAILLVIWLCLTGVLAWRFMRRYQAWTGMRMGMTQDLVEAMVGHRTRLAQQPRERWHDEEDAALDRYLVRSRETDGTGTWLVSWLPRGWLIAGLACLAPEIVSGKTAVTEIAITLGGILLAFTGFKRLADAFVDIAAAWVPWKRIGPLFRAASRPERSGKVFAGEKTAEPDGKVIEADRLTFRYRNIGNPALQSSSLVIRRGERILLEGPSGGGKTTFASLLSGMREAESGLLLVNGLDRHTLGDKRWRKHVAAAPQFHENHIVTGTLAFNLLMGRGWPPTQKDMCEAESVCRDLGLGDLLDKMPSGLMQMVGEGGWQLSHGELSRIYIARALLQNADLVILDESFAALDPENLQTALESTLERAETLMVIAHP